MSENPTAKPPRIKHRAVAWASGGVILAFVAALAGFPAGRHLVGRFMASLREPPLQSVNLNLGSFAGPNANPTVQQMISRMISANVTTVISGKRELAQNPAQGSQLAGFKARLLGARRDAPQLSVSGQRTLRIIVDRARLQSILREAGRGDLVVPASVNGAAITLSLPRMLRARYGTCPMRSSAAANVATPPPISTRYSDCLVLVEGPHPQINTPAGFHFAPLAQIGLEAAGMTSEQAKQFLQRVNWRSLLGVPIPRFLRSYASVDVDNAKGTLFNMAARRGPTYALIWSKGDLVYSLVGFGDSLDAVKLADSLN
ncbi:MAG: hypothetical protein ACREUT_17230 [Steroidobacteraceae bacterium]